MLVITNRKIVKGIGLKQFGKGQNEHGAKELRLFDVDETNNGWDVKLRDDVLDKETVKKLKKRHNLNIDVDQKWYQSLQAACDLFTEASKKRKSILFYIHGFNNDMDDVMKAAYEIEHKHEVIVVPISWPANGGGAISGVASYLSDKSDARGSVGALDNVIKKIGYYHKLLSEGAVKSSLQKAESKFKDNTIGAIQYHAETISENCVVKLSLLCHSMGSYVFKKTFGSSDSSTSNLVFDNVCLVSADTNSHDHSDWVSKIDVRNRIYVVINENDSALRVSRIKPGSEQKARLGHYLKNLNCPTATYIDVTDIKHVGSEHTYFKGEAIKNKLLKEMFTSMFQGETVERSMEYFVQSNSFRLKDA